MRLSVFIFILSSCQVMKPLNLCAVTDLVSPLVEVQLVVATACLSRRLRGLFERDHMIKITKPQSGCTARAEFILSTRASRIFSKLFWHSSFKTGPLCLHLTALCLRWRGGICFFLFLSYRMTACHRDAPITFLQVNKTGWPADKELKTPALLFPLARERSIVKL